MTHHERDRQSVRDLDLLSRRARRPGDRRRRATGSYGDGPLTGALVAAALALIALVAVPTFRPLTVQQAAMH